eukprot:scaffold85666_cov26-Tisochrysis_lutea.AAC.3
MTVGPGGRARCSEPDAKARRSLALNAESRTCSTAAKASARMVRLIAIAWGCRPNEYSIPPPTHGQKMGLKRSMKAKGP